MKSTNHEDKNLITCIITIKNSIKSSYEVEEIFNTSNKGFGIYFKMLRRKENDVKKKVVYLEMS